ncbi:hypothetical protein [Dongia rigui]|uniref:Uncharacterized protein n=1 Tax=Dongia rigui TaxID=940149 RepID=A0ABU5DYQ0_9PROT|nr:hypothetical protein [Dongia rigui]MDY0872457.1 hypothetical protein [Dongia rigui]
MSDTQIAAAQQKRWSFWPHLAFSTLLSLIMPYLGSTYLGLKSPDKKIEWQRKAMPISAAMLAAIAIPYLLNLSLAPLIFFALAWALNGIASVVVLWRAALRSDASISIAPSGFNSLLLVFNILVFAWLGSLSFTWPDISLFRATETTPVVATGDLLYGLKYTPITDDNGWSRRDQSGRIERGQLLLARIEGKESLVRVLAVPGDIFATADDALLINGSRVSLRSLTEPWDKDRLNKLAHDIATAGDIAGADALDQLVQSQAKVVQTKRLLVARDAAFLKPAFGAAVPVLEISEEDVVLVPWAKFWSMGDHPGAKSDIAQPSNLFFRGS